MRAASCFSGIGAAELALPEAEWLWSAEVDPFANAVRAQRLNDHNLGDALAQDFIERAESFGPLDLLIGGPPCQDFSIAGLRAGLDGDRGNLSLRWVQIINALRPRYAVTENVPGWLSVNRGHAFGAFIAGLVGHDTALLPPKECGGRWTDAGMVDGPDGRLCWRTLDAQFFGLAQRRRRVFVVYCPRDGGDPAQVLLERKGVQGNHPPRREAGKTTARTLEASADGSGGRLPEITVAPTLPSRRTAGGGLGTDFDCDGGLITHSLRADGFDAGEDGTGRGTPLVTPFDFKQIRSEANYSNPQPGDPCHPLTAQEHPPAIACGRGGDIAATLQSGVGGNGNAGNGCEAIVAFAQNQRDEVRCMDVAGALAAEPGTKQQTYAITAFSGMAQGGAGWAPPSCPTSDDCALPLDATRAQAVAFQQSQSGFRQHETHATLDSNNGSRRRNGVVQALCEGGHGVTEMDTATAVQSGGGKAGQGYQAVREGASSVRRLTPRECERLQGFPDGWTDVVYRGKAASDGARYKCLGNAFAVPVVTWIARRMVREDALALAPAEVAA